MVDKSLAFDRSRVVHEHIGKLGRDPDPRVYTSTAVMYLKPPPAAANGPTSPRGRNSPRFHRLSSRLSQDADDVELKFVKRSRDDAKVRLQSVSNVYEEEESPSKDHSINVSQPALNSGESKFIFRSRKLNPSLMPKTGDGNKKPSRTWSLSSTGQSRDVSRSESVESDVFSPCVEGPDRVFEPLTYGSDQVYDARGFAAVLLFLLNSIVWSRKIG